MWQVVGHERAVRLLQKSIDTGRISHAYLFSGPRQVGKRTLAREFAKALNCLKPNLGPCGECRSCRKIERSIHPDVQALELEEGSKNISIGAVRGLQEGIALRPSEGRAKVYIIEEAQRLSESAANSLLKTLEEPPPSVVLLLTTLDATLLLPTIVSRCQQVELHPVPALAVEAAIRQHQPEQADKARMLAGLAKGRVGWALQAASNPALLTKRLELLERLIGLPATGGVGRFAYASELAALYGRDPEAAHDVLESWQFWWRDLLLFRLDLADMVVNVDLTDRLAGEARRYTAEAMGRMIKAIQDTTSLLAQNVNARLSLELLMMKVPSAAYR